MLQLDQIWTRLIGGKYNPVHDVIVPRPMSRDQKQKNAYYENGLNIFFPYFLYNNNSKAVSKKFKHAFWLMMKNKEMRKENVPL